MPHYSYSFAVPGTDRYLQVERTIPNWRLDLSEKEARAYYKAYQLDDDITFYLLTFHYMPYEPWAGLVTLLDQIRAQKKRPTKAQHAQAQALIQRALYLRQQSTPVLSVAA